MVGEIEEQFTEALRLLTCMQVPTFAKRIFQDRAHSEVK
jgi:hypothetical protein